MVIEKTITATEGTFDGKLSIEFVLAITQDVLTSYFGTLGVDNASMRKNFNAIWVVAKNKATVYSRPFWNENTVVNCSFVKVGRFTCYCLTEMKTLSGDKVFSVLSELCSIYLENFRFLSLDLLPIPKENIMEIDKSNFAFTMPENKDFTENLSVSPLLIDFSNHLNNAKLLFPIIDRLSVSELKNIYEGTFEIIIHYKKQAMSGENVSLSLTKQENAIFFDYKLQDGTISSEGCIRKTVK